MTTNKQMGPDRATYKHWLDRESKAVIGPADCLRVAKKRFGPPCAIARRNDRTEYAWQVGFDRFCFTIYRK